MKKRTYGTGSFYRRPSGKYLLRYQGKTKTVIAANDKQADRELSKWVGELDAREKGGATVIVNDLFDGYLADHRKHNRAETPTVQKKIDKYLRPRIGKLDARKFRCDDMDAYLASRLKEKHPQTKRSPENATPNREISIVARSLRLAADKIQRIVRF